MSEHCTYGRTGCGRCQIGLQRHCGGPDTPARKRLADCFAAEGVHGEHTVTGRNGYDVHRKGKLPRAAQPYGKVQLSKARLVAQIANGGERAGGTKAARKY